MKRLQENYFIIYDAQIIIYYCFLFKEHKIIELTNNARILTRFLINNNIKITAPKSIINEIKNKGFAKIISDYTNSKYPIQIIGLEKTPTKGFEYLLQRRIEGNFNNMIHSKWFEVKSYTLPETSINSIKNFFETIEDEFKLENFLIKKEETTRYLPEQTWN